MSTPTTTATAEGVDAALNAIDPAGLTDAQIDAEIDSALSGEGDIKPLGVAAGWWAGFIAWLRELIKAGKEEWKKWSDFIKDHLTDILNAGWYWMPLPNLPIPGNGI